MRAHSVPSSFLRLGALGLIGVLLTALVAVVAPASAETVINGTQYVDGTQSLRDITCWSASDCMAVGNSAWGEFSVDASRAGPSVAVNGAQARYTTSSLGVGAHTVNVAYSGEVVATNSGAAATSLPRTGVDTADLTLAGPAALFLGLLLAWSADLWCRRRRTWARHSSEP